MIDIDKQIAYWRDGAEDDWEVAQVLVNRGKIPQGLFFAHLALEKALKAHVCKHTQDLAPKIHNLPTLAEKAALETTDEVYDVLSDMNDFNLIGRYPDQSHIVPTQKEADVYMRRTKGALEWLVKRL